MNFFARSLRRLIGTNRIINQNTSVINILEGQNRLIQEIYNANVFNSSIEGSSWLKDKSFSPGRWAVDYSCLYILYRILNDMKPNSIIEFGLGQSTKILYQYAQAYNAELVTFEHDKNWIDFFSNSITNYDESFISLVETETVTYKGKNSLRFQKEYLDSVNEGIELVFLDAPFGSKRYSRIQILDMLPEKLNKNNFCILMDDSQREGEKDTIKEVLTLLENSNIPCKTNEFKGETNQFLICSPNNSFLLSI